MTDNGPKSSTINDMGKSDDSPSLPPVARHALGWGGGASGIGLAVYLLMQQMDGTSAAVKELTGQVETMSSDIKAIRYEVRNAVALQEKTNAQAQKERDAAVDALIKMDDRVDRLERGRIRR